MQHPDNWDAAEVVREQAEKNARRIWTVLPGADLDYKTNYNNFIADNSADINSLFGILGMQVADYHNASTPCVGDNGTVSYTHLTLPTIPGV